MYGLSRAIGNHARIYILIYSNQQSSFMCLWCLAMRDQIEVPSENRPNVQQRDLDGIRGQDQLYCMLFIVSVLQTDNNIATTEYANYGSAWCIYAGGVRRTPSR